MSPSFILVMFVIVGPVITYAMGYFHQRRVPAPPDKDPEMPSDPDGCLRVLYQAYSEEVKAKYKRNHARRRSEKFLKEFTLASFHFLLFVLVAVACAKIEAFTAGTNAATLAVGLVFVTLGLKAGQLTASKETAEQKEMILIHATEIVNAARANMLANCPSDTWSKAFGMRDERSPLHYGYDI